MSPTWWECMLISSKGLRSVQMEKGEMPPETIVRMVIQQPCARDLLGDRIAAPEPPKDRTYELREVFRELRKATYREVFG